MCGIFGTLQHRSCGVPSKEKLLRTTRALQHRGPDSSGIYRNSGIALAHTRLSLVDLNPRSDQPMWDPSGRYALVYNGEIYNFRDLCDELQHRGVAFKTSSDTEVLLQCLIVHGVKKTLKIIEGMYAFCFYDSEEHVFLLARDRFGIKPLFTYQDDDQFIFSSELLAMQRWFKFVPDYISVSAYLQGFGFPTKGFSLVHGVRILAPGEILRVTCGEKARSEQFASMVDLWNPREASSLSRLRPTQVIDRFDELFRKSVERQMFADVPVGAYCSGGVDSSLVMAVAHQFHSNLAIFHANVLSNSETAAARALAKHLRLDLEVVEVSDQDFIDAMAETIVHFGAPFTYHPNSVPFFAVSKLVRKSGIKAMLSGEGSDECYLGYPWLVPKLRDRIRSLLVTGRATFRRLFRKPQFRSQKRTTKPIIDQAVYLHNRFEHASELAEIQRLRNTLSQSGTDTRGLVSLEQLTYHLRTLLHRNDALGMAASVEARFPFLDTELVRFAANLPYKFKVHFHPFARNRQHNFYVDKWIVRRVADRYLPKTLSRRRKMGFPTSAYRRMNIPSTLLYGGLVEEMFELSRNDIDFLVQSADQNMKLNLLQINVWAELFIEGTSPQIVQERLSEHLSIEKKR